jgi:hypothetical protein
MVSKDIPIRWDELNHRQKLLVERYIATLLAQQAELPLIQKAGREVIEQKKERGISYQLEKVKCGKKKCKCAEGALHGPYWYAYWRDGKRVKSKYIGRTLKKIDWSQEKSYPTLQPSKLPDC